MPDSSGYDPGRALDALLDSLDEGVIVFDAGGVCRAVGRRAAEILGLEQDALTGLRRDAILARVTAGMDGPDPLAPLVEGEREVVDLVRPRPCTVVWTSTLLAEGAGRLDIVRDVTRERRAEAKAQELQRRLELEGTLDELTGLTNRRRFEEECGREHRRAQREWVSYAVARIDVDRMAGINDALGRDAGDDLLRRIAEELRSSRREYDVVGRYASDEFALLLPRADAAAVRKVLTRAIEGVHEKGRVIAPGMSVSAGAAIWSPPCADGPGDVLRRAGDALRAARAKGSATIEIDAVSRDWQDIGDA